MSARRAVARWSWRLFRREWRQQILVLALLTVAVTGAVGAIAAAHGLTPGPEGQVGNASHAIHLPQSDAARAASALATIRDRFPAAEVVGHRSVAVPGSVDQLEVRSQDPDGPLGAPMLAAVSGRFPREAGEVAVTDRALPGVDVGDTVTFEDERQRVVGVVENPGDLGDEFALVTPGRPGDRVLTVLVQADEDEVHDLLGSADGLAIERRDQDESTVAAATVLVLVTVVLLLVGLVASAGFVVLAHRRLRQLGMLAATGATERHLRLAMAVDGFAVGVVAAATGTVLALAGWAVLAPRAEAGTGHRIDRADLPWAFLAAGVLLAVAASTLAAWWPARSVSRLPVVVALSARPPTPRPGRRSAVAAAVLVAGGVLGLATALDVNRDEANVPLVLAGTLALVVGVLLAAPLAIRALGHTGRRAPVAVRLALRDLVRHQARSGAALAAISLGLGLAVAVVIGASAAEPAVDEGNLSDRQLLVSLGDAEPVVPVHTDEEHRRLAAAVATMVDGAEVLPLEVAVGPGRDEYREGQAVRPAVVLGRPVEEQMIRDVGRLYVARPDLLAHLGVDPATVGPDTDVLTPQEGELTLANLRDRPPVPTIQVIDTPRYSSAPTSLVTEAALERLGWEAVPAGWLVEADATLTPDQIAHAQDVAAEAGVTVEARDDQGTLEAVRRGATAAGLLLALGIVALTVGLIRSEAAGDLRTLAATGAPASTRRALTAATAGALALLGALLGTAGAYLALGAGYDADLARLGRVPVAHLAVTLVGIPVAAWAVGWLLAGREPAAMARAAIE